MYTSNPGTLEAKTGGWEFKASLGYAVSSWLQSKPVSKKNKQTKTKGININIIKQSLVIKGFPYVIFWNPHISPFFKLAYGIALVHGRRSRSIYSSSFLITIPW
jgi:hypothetical protein